MEAALRVNRLVVITMGRESDYYIWLRELVGDRRKYKKLLQHLDTIPYTWIFTLDENRAAGGTNLRREYAWDTSTDTDDVRNGPCTVLEMLIGVASHMEDQIGRDVSDCFWMIIENLCLDQFDDSNYDPQGVESIIKTWLNHDYESNGAGSIFPLRNYPGDCRNLDIWSQMNAWISENFPSDDSWLK